MDQRPQRGCAERRVASSTNKHRRGTTVNDDDCERGLRVMIHLVRRSAAYELPQLFVLASRFRALLAVPIAERDPRAVPQFLRKLDSDCARLFATRFEDLATVDPDAVTPTLDIVLEQLASWSARLASEGNDPHLHLEVGRHLALLGAAERARPHFEAFGRLDPARPGFARGWYLLASLLEGHVDECVKLLRRTREAGDFQYADGDAYLEIYEAWTDALNGVLRAFQRVNERLLDARREDLRGASFVYFELALAAAATGRLDTARRALERVVAVEVEPLYVCAVAAHPAFDALWADDATRVSVEQWYANAARAFVLPERHAVREMVARQLAALSDRDDSSR